jgi:hypothetical protein
MNGLKLLATVTVFWCVVSGALTWAVPPPPPDLITAEEAPCAFNLRGVYVGWRPSEGSVAFRIYRDWGQVAEVSLFNDTETYQYWRNWNVVPGATHWYTVTALNVADEESGSSAPAWMETTSCGPLPTQPLDLVAVPTGCDSVLLAWTPGAAGERQIRIVDIVRTWPSTITAYRIRRATSADVGWITSTSVRTFLDWHIGAAGSEPDNWYMDDGSLTPRYGEPLTGGGTYYYAVQALNAQGNRSLYSDVVQVTLPPCP